MMKKQLLIALCLIAFCLSLSSCHKNDKFPPADTTITTDNQEDSKPPTESQPSPSEEMPASETTKQDIPKLLPPISFGPIGTGYRSTYGDRLAVTSGKALYFLDGDGAIIESQSGRYTKIFGDADTPAYYLSEQNGYLYFITEEGLMRLSLKTFEPEIFIKDIANYSVYGNFVYYKDSRLWTADTNDLTHAVVLQTNASWPIAVDQGVLYQIWYEGYTGPRQFYYHKSDGQLVSVDVGEHGEQAVGDYIYYRDDISVGDNYESSIFRLNLRTMEKEQIFKTNHFIQCYVATDDMVYVLEAPRDDPAFFFPITSAVAATKSLWNIGATGKIPMGLWKSYTSRAFRCWISIST